MILSLSGRIDFNVAFLLRMLTVCSFFVMTVNYLELPYAFVRTDCAYQ